MVNGTIIDYNSEAGNYYGYVEGIGAGDNVNLLVQISDVNISQSTFMPERLEITAPDQTQEDVTEEIIVTWNALFNETDYVEITIQPSFTADGSKYIAIEPGTATSHIIPAGTFADKGNLEVEVLALNAADIDLEDTTLGSLNVYNGETATFNVVSDYRIHEGRSLINDEAATFRVASFLLLANLSIPHRSKPQPNSRCELD